jgi:hypothetical protein
MHVARACDIQLRSMAPRISLHPDLGGPCVTTRKRPRPGPADKNSALPI